MITERQVGCLKLKKIDPRPTKLWIVVLYPLKFKDVDYPFIFSNSSLLFALIVMCTQMTMLIMRTWVSMTQKIK